MRNYKSLGIVNNPNFLGARSSTRDTVISKSLQVPNGAQDMIADDGSDVESDGTYLFIYHSPIFVCLKFDVNVCHSLN